MVLLDYQQPRRPPKGIEIDRDLHCLTPGWVQRSRHIPWPAEEAAALELGPYEYYQSLVARAVRWAAGREAPITLLADLPDAPPAGQEMAASIRLEGEGPVASVTAAVRADDGQKVFEQSRPVDTAAANVPLHLPPLPAGRYLFDMWARDEQGGVLEWGSRAFAVHGDNAVREVELVHRLLGAGDNVGARVQLARPLVPGQKLSAELWDLHGRHIATQEAVSLKRAASVEVFP